MIAATDAHAKNYALLHAIGPQLRLAPLYDILTVLPYPQLNPAKSRLAMTIGGERAVGKIDATHWRQLGKQVGLSAERILDRVRTVAARIPLAVDALNARKHPDEYTQTLVAHMGSYVAEHARACVARL